MSTAAALIRNTRLGLGLTQTQLAQRLGVKQSVVARLERTGSNPTLATVERALQAMGRQLQLEATERPSNLDESLIVRNLRLTPAQRLAEFESAHADVRELARRARNWHE